MLSPAEQFDQSLQRVWRDKSKVELILKMTTVQRRRGGDDDEEGNDGRACTAQAFASVFTETRLMEWQRLVQERHWKSICFVHDEIEMENGEQEMDHNAIHAAAAAAVDAVGAEATALLAAAAWGTSPEKAWLAPASIIESLIANCISSSSVEELATATLLASVSTKDALITCCINSSSSFFC